MNINIKYNDNQELICDLSLQMRLKNYINNHFYPAYVISELAPIYLVGGSIRDLINATKPKDLDFVILGKDHLDWVLTVLNAYKIKFTLNKFGVTIKVFSSDLVIAPYSKLISLYSFKTSTLDNFLYSKSSLIFSTSDNFLVFI